MKLKEIKPGMVIRCSNKEEKSMLLKELAEQGYLWAGKEYPTREEFYTGNTIHIYEPSDLYKYKHITWSDREGNINFSDLIIPELSTEEVLEIRNDLGFDFVREYLGLCCGHSLDGMLRKATPEQIIDMCIKWKNRYMEPKLEKIHVGDVVTDGHSTMLVTGVGGKSGLLFMIGKDGEILTRMNPKYWKKTGKQIDIQSILAEIGKEN